jgi:lipoate---protein ligase
MSNLITWRFLPLIETSGVMQMTIDEWLLEKHRQGNHPPTLRFYTWKSATISLGYHQKNYPEYWLNLTWQGELIELVQRPSGGRAVLHQGDLTYAVISSELGGKRRESYEKICQFLIEGWRNLGMNLYYGNAGRGYIHNPNCFGTATDADLVTEEGYKLIGSAQLRRDRAILQHGSMRLNPDVGLFEEVFNEKITPINLSVFSIDRIIEELSLAAIGCFGIKLVKEELTNEEWAEILLLMKNKPAKV